MDTKEPLESQQVADSTPSAGPAGSCGVSFSGRAAASPPGSAWQRYWAIWGSMPCPTRPAGLRLRSAFCIR